MTQQQTDPAVAAVITVNDMYHELQGVREAVTTLAGKFDDVPRQLSEHAGQLASQAGQLRKLDGVPSELGDHETRMRAMEAHLRETVTRKTMYTALALLATFLGAAGSFVGVLVH